MLAFAGVIAAWTVHVIGNDPYVRPEPAATATPAAAAVDPAEAERCKVPHFAKAIGLEETWKRHNNCL